MKLFLVFVLVASAALTVCAAEQEPCPRFCTMDYRPVCAADAAGNERTFSNPCVLTSFNCEQNKDFVVVRKGSCLNDEH